MPCGHGRSSSNVQKIADRRSSASKRLVVPSNQKEGQAPELSLKNFRHRWYICTIIFFRYNENWKRLPGLPLLQGTDARSHSESGASFDMDGLESSPQPETCTEVDLSNQRTDSSNMILCSSSALVKFSEQSESTGYTIEHNDSRSISLSKKMASRNPSGSVDGDISPTSLDLLVNDAPKENKTMKRNSKKKGKKKGKQYKKTASKIFFSEGSSNASLVETSMKNLQSSDNMTVPTICLVRNSQTEKEDIRNDNSSATLVSSTSGGDAMDESECTDSPHSISSDNKPITIQSEEIVISKYNEDAHCKEDTGLRNNSCSMAVNSFSSSAADSFLDGWNGDISENCSDDTEIVLTSKEENRQNSSEGELTSASVKFSASFSTRTIKLSSGSSEMLNDGKISNLYRSSNVLDICSDTDKAEYSSQACSSNGFHLVVSGKRARKARKMTVSGKLEGTNRSVALNSCGRAGRDNVCSVWQKVQKVDTEKPSIVGHEIASTRDGETPKNITEFGVDVHLKDKAGKSYRYPCSDDMNKKATFHMVSSAVKSGQAVVKSAAGNHANIVKSKFSSASKKANHSFMSDSCADASKVGKPQKYHVHQKEALLPSSLVNNTKSMRPTLASLISQPPLLVNQTDKRDHCKSQIDQEGVNSAEVVISPSITSSTACGRNLPAECSNAEQLCIDFGFFKKPIAINSESNDSSTCSIGIHAVPIQYPDGSQSTNSESESSYTEFSNVHNSTAVPLQKSIHLSSRDLDVKEMVHVDVAKEAVLDISCPKNAELDKYCFLSSGVEESSCSRPSSRDTEFSSSESVESTFSFRSHSYSADEISDLSSNQTWQVKNQEIYGFETNLEKIRRYVFYAYKLLTTTENVPSATRAPITNVERFLYSVSPVILHKNHRESCTACPREELIDHSLCWHQVPDIFLRNLWYWYEEPGCFGLEVKAQDHFHSEEFGEGSGFNAYFVPYLSAVQLFAKSRSTGHLSKEINGCLGELSSSVQDDLVDQSAHGKTGDGELMFEYFESDQPHWRRPLYEKIKELVSGQTSSCSKIFGDPWRLESMKLQDLHPASWFCVAWYPIYCIPDGNFRAAFLTYHSLGCFIDRSFSSSNSHDLKSIASPVVGLQMYNVKGEGWFQPRSSGSKPVAPSQLVKERLRVLKETATVMATAVVSKGGQRSLNHHPDYQFFLSRAR